MRRLYFFGLFFILSAMQPTNACTDDSDEILLVLPAIIASASNPWQDWPPAGNASGNCPVPVEAGLEDTSQPDHVVGNGTPQSCTSEAVVSTIAKGGVITFDCGAKPMVIELEETAKIFNNTGPKIVIDGKGKVALSGKMVRRILYMNTCDPNQVWTTPHCQNQDHPRLTVQNLTLLAGNSSSEPTYDGGGAIWARGGRLKTA